MRVSGHLGFVLSFLATLLVVSVARTQTPITERVSVDSYGGQANADSIYPAISGDGRFVAFFTYASTLVVGDTNGFEDVFVHDRQTGAIERVSVASNGAQGNGWGSFPALSSDGRFVAFASSATNLIAGDTNARTDILVRDRLTGTTERVSLSSTNVQAFDHCYNPSISGDGRFVEFFSRDATLVPGDTNAASDVFVRDRVNSSTERVSVDSAGMQANGDCDIAAISTDGQYVVFRSFASNLVAGDTNGYPDVFVRDRVHGTTERVSVATNGTQANQWCGNVEVSISDDGRFVAFASSASNLVAGDTNGTWDIFVHDRTAATTERVSVATSGAQANSFSPYSASISGDGRFVAFGSFASNLVAGDTNGFFDTFVHDRFTGKTERVSVSTTGDEGSAESSQHRTPLSTDGRFVVFSSAATNLVAGDSNGGYDVFVRDLVGSPVTYCTSGTTSNGCSATIAASANPSLSSAHVCTVQVTSVDGQRSGILFYGVNNSGFEPRPFATGSTSWLCVQPPTQRTPIQTSSGTSGACDGSFALDWNAYQSANPLALGNPWTINAKVYVQAWFRDPLAVKTSNLSNVLALTYVP